MSDQLRPVRVDYRCGRSRIISDEDGTHVHPSGPLEEAEFDALAKAWREARKQRRSGWIPAPEAPTREQIATMRYEDQRAYAADEAVSAVRKALS